MGDERERERERMNQFIAVQSNIPVFALYDRIEYKQYSWGREKVIELYSKILHYMTG